MPDIVLGASEISKSYGRVQANRGITLGLGPGRIHAVVGENGAGKSTLMRILQGGEQPDRGRVIVDDRPVTLTSPADALSRGIGMVHQEFMLAPDLSLLENIVLGHEPPRRGPAGRALIDWTAAEAEGRALAARIGIAVDWSRRAGSAPVHVQQFAEIIRLLRRGIRTLILDEPTAVLAPPQVGALFDLLRRLRDGGTSILFISHKIREVMALADDVTVLRQGAVAFAARVDRTTAEEIAGHIVQGAQPAAIRARRAASPGAPVLEVEELSAPSIARSRALHGVTLSVRAGEIVGLAGVAGNGQVELMEALYGLRRHTGRVALMGADVSALDAAGRRRCGIGYISPDRKHEGLALGASIAENAVAGSHRTRPVGSRLWLRRGALRRLALERMARLSVVFGRPEDAVGSLSGGNQQRVVFAREIATAPPLLLVCQPTRGVDLNGIAAIHTILDAYRAGGGAVLLLSEELDELQHLSDRILVMVDGRLVGAFDADDDRQTIGRAMVLGDAR